MYVLYIEIYGKGFLKRLKAIFSENELDFKRKKMIENFGKFLLFHFMIVSKGVNIFFFSCNRIHLGIACKIKSIIFLTIRNGHSIALIFPNYQFHFLFTPTYVPLTQVIFECLFTHMCIAHMSYLFV